MQFRTVFFFLAIAVLAASTSCAAEKPVIAVIPKGSTHEHWKAVHAGALKGAKEFGVEILWKGPLKEDDREQQISVVEDFINRGVQGIALAPLDDVALGAPVKEAVKEKIPVIVFDSDLKSGEYISFVATDNYAGGKIAGEHMAKILGGKGKVVMLRYAEGSASTAEREKGFLDALKAHANIKVVSDNQYAGPTTESAQKASENLLAPLKGDDGKLTIDGIYTVNESSTFGMLRALQDADLAGKVKFVGFDASAKLIDGLKKGQVDGLVVQNPVKMGYLTVKAMAEHLKGQKVEKRIDTGATMVSRENIEQPEIKELLSPVLGKAQ